MKNHHETLTPSHPILIAPETHPHIPVRKIGLDFLKTLQGKKVLLYVSSSQSFENYLSLPFDYIILSNNSFFRKMKLVGDKIIEFPFENNKTLRLLHETGVKICCFVGIQDGCCEGGNFECVNSPAFFGRLSPVLENKVLYIANHWSFFSSIHNIVRRRGFLNTHYRLATNTTDLPVVESSAQFSYYHGDKDRKFMLAIERVDADTVEAKVGNISLMVSRTSVWEHRFTSDCIIHSDIYHEADGFFDEKGTFLNYGLYKNNPRKILEDALQYQWSSITMIPFLKGQYKDFVKMCSAWEGAYPQRIHFCHLEDRDLAELRLMIKNKTL